MSELRTALDRAERFRRDQVPERDRGGIANRIWAQPEWWPRPIANGWQAIGRVFEIRDDQASALEVHFHPATKRVRAQRPVPPARQLPKPVEPAPERRPIWPIAAGGFAAEAGWVFTLDGRDYTPEQAGLHANLDNLSRWTWRRQDKGNSEDGPDAVN